MFYVAAHTPLNALHDQVVFQKEAAAALAGTGIHYAPPYVRPTVFVLALLWMRSLPYWTAYTLWASLQFSLYLATLWLLSRRLGVPVLGQPLWMLFFPVFFGIITGQDAIGVGFSACAGLAALLAGYPVVAGLILSLTLYKFNLFLLVPLYLLVRREWVAVASYCFGALILATASILMEPPSTYITLLLDIQRYTVGFSVQSMLSLRALTVSFSWLYPPAALAVACTALWAARRLPPAEGFGVLEIASVLSAWHSCWYDGAILTLPLGLALKSNVKTMQILGALLLLFPLWNVFNRAASLLLLVLFGLYIIRAKQQPPQISM